MRTPFWWWKPARSSSVAVTRICYAAAAATPRSSACSSATPAISPRSAPPNKSLPEHGHHDQAEHRGRHGVFQRVVDLAVPVLEAAAGRVDSIDAAEEPVQHADLLPFHVLGRGRLHDVVADPAVDRRHEAVLH